MTDVTTTMAILAAASAIVYAFAVDEVENLQYTKTIAKYLFLIFTLAGVFGSWQLFAIDWLPPFIWVMVGLLVFFFAIDALIPITGRIYALMTGRKYQTSKKR